MAGAWIERPRLNIARGGLASATTEGGIYAIGGYPDAEFTEMLDSVEVLRPGTDQWQLAASMLTRRGNSGAAAVGNNIYVFGGFDTPDHVTDGAERFNAGMQKWEPIKNLDEPTASCGVAALGGRIYILGSDSDSSRVRIYHPQTNNYEDAPSMPTGRPLLKAAALGGLLYAIGGVNDEGNALAVVERYDPGTNTWETVAPMLTPRANPGVLATADRIFVVGGGGNGRGPGRFGHDSAEMFNPNTKKWKLLDAHLAVGRGSPCAERAPGNVMLAIGGFEPRNQPFTASSRVEALNFAQL